MNISNVITALISIFSSSLITLILSSIIFEPMKEKKKYIFDEKKRVYEAIIVFAQIVLYPQKSKYSLGVERYDIQQLSNKECVKNALNDLIMSVPKVKLITKNKKIINLINEFVTKPSENTFDSLVEVLQKDLYK